MPRDSALIAFDATPLQKEKSGIGIYTENLIRSLLETGECRVALLSNRAVVAERALEAAGRHESGRCPVRALWMQAVLPRLLAQVRPSLCHFPNYLAPLRAPCPRVVTLHDMSLHRHPEFFSSRKRHLSRRLLPLVAERAEGIITVSEYARREIVELLGVPRRRVHVIYEAASRNYRPVTDPLDLEAVRRRHGLTRRFVLSVGTIEPRKNTGRLLTAFENLVERGGPFADLELVLVGASGWKNESLRERIRQAQARGRVRYLGYFPREELPALYSLASVVAYPSIYEGFGLPVVEAMACGTPVLTSNRTSMIEIAGGAAWLVDPESTESIQRGLEGILLHRDLAVELSQRGRERAARFSWSEAAARTLEVYREVLRPARPSSGHRGRIERNHAPERADGAGAAPLTETPVRHRRAEVSCSILRTVIYADLFDSPIEIGALHRFLIGCRATREEVEACLDEDPWLRDRISRQDDLVLLQGRECLAERRRHQQAQTRELVQRNGRLLRLVALIPFLRLLAFSGGTSHENSPGQADLDLFLVTARGRVWTVYGLVVLIARLFGRRRLICANYLVDADHLRLPRSGDLFTGHELLFIKPLAGAFWADRLMEANPWIKDLFPNAGALDNEHLRPGHPRLQRAAEIVLGPVWFFGERIARQLFQRRIARHTKASPTADVRVEDGILKLHLEDRRAPALSRFRERLDQAGVWHPALARCLRVDPPAEEEVAAAWDAAAAGYDANEESNVLLRALRGRYREEVENWVEPGASVCDLGCGTGIDAVWLLQKGHDVTGVDVSPVMISRLREREAAQSRGGTRGRLQTHVLSLDHLDHLAADPQRRFDAVLANFGSLNCAAQPVDLARALARLVRPGGHVVAAVLNRVCLWETVYHLLRCRPRAAFRRWGRGMRTAMVAGGTVDVWYPTPARFVRLFRDDFDVVRLRPHGLVAPPPYLNRLVARWPRLYRRLELWEDRAFHGSRGAGLADHFLVVLRRRGVEPPAWPDEFARSGPEGREKAESMKTDPEQSMAEPAV